jgi:hypothetical protein
VDSSLGMEYTHRKVPARRNLSGKTNEMGQSNLNLFLTMSDVIMTDVVEEESSHPSKQRPVNGGKAPRRNVHSAFL